MMPRILRKLTIREVSGVDKGAGEGARIVLMKRKLAEDAERPEGELPEDELPGDEESEKEPSEEVSHETAEDEIDTPEKEEASDEKASDEEPAVEEKSEVPAGVYPVETPTDLKVALTRLDLGRIDLPAKDYLIARAEALGATSALPPDWRKAGPPTATSPLAPPRDPSGGSRTPKPPVPKGPVVQIPQARPSVLAKLLHFFRKEDVSAALAAAVSEEKEEEECPLSREIVEAVDALSLSIVSIVEDEAIGEKRRHLLDKTCGQFKDHVRGLVDKDAESKKADAEAPKPQKTDSDKPDPEKPGTETEKGDVEARDEAKGDVEARDVAASSEHLPLAVRKALQRAERDREILKTLQEKDRLRTFAKRAEEMGFAPAFGTVLMKARSGEPTAWSEIEGVLQSLSEQVRIGKVFSEFGTSQGGDATDPRSQMRAAVAEVRKSDPALSEDRAIAKIAEMPQHRNLWKAYKGAGR